MATADNALYPVIERQKHAERLSNKVKALHQLGKRRSIEFASAAMRFERGNEKASSGKKQDALAGLHSSQAIEHT